MIYFDVYDEDGNKILVHEGDKIGIENLGTDDIKEMKNFVNRNPDYDYYFNKYKYLQDHFISGHHLFNRRVKEDKRFKDISVVEYISHHDTFIIRILEKKIRDIFKKDKNNRINTEILKNVRLGEMIMVFLIGNRWKEISQKLDLINIDEIHTDIYPDMIALRKCKDGSVKRVNIEFETISSNFWRHEHPVDICDIIICWKHDWIECPENIEVMELCNVKNENNMNGIFQMNDNGK